MVIAIAAVLWIVVGFAAAAVFGFVLSRSNPVDEDDVPNRTGAQVQYMRRLKGTGCNLVRPSRAPRQTGKRHTAG